MGRHVADRGASALFRWFGGRWFGRGRTRALLALGTVLAVGAVGTGAYWTDTATVTGGTLTSGSMDLQVAQTTSGPWGAEGTGAAYAATHIAVTNITPSESYTFSMAVRNVGNSDFDYGITVTQGTVPAWTFVGTPITVQLFAGAPVTTDTTYPIQQTCSGTSLGPATSVTASSSTVVPASRRLNKGVTDAALCVLVTMVSGADNANQGKQGQLRFDLTAQQVTS